MLNWEEIGKKKTKIGKNLIKITPFFNKHNSKLKSVQ